MKPVPFEPLDPGVYRELVRRALAEDFGWGDVTTEGIIDRNQKAHAAILAKSSCVLAGLDVASETFRQLDPGLVVTVRRDDGEQVSPGTVVAEYVGQASALLTAELDDLGVVAVALHAEHLGRNAEVRVLAETRLGPATEDALGQTAPDGDYAAGVIKRYGEATQVRAFDGNPATVTEMDALVAYLQILGHLTGAAQAEVVVQPEDGE